MNSTTTTTTTTTTGTNNDTIDDTITTTSSSSSVDTPPNSIFMITVCAPTNIAVIKYWGKQNVQYNTPINSSVSVTLNMNDHLCAITTIAAIKKQKQQQQTSQNNSSNSGNGNSNGDRLWLNGIEDDTASTNQRFRSCIDGVKELATDVIFSNDNDDDDDDNEPKKKKKSSIIVVTKDDWKNHMSFHISSYNTFPTAAGLASSAAGYAALVYGLAQLMNAKEQYPYQLSTIARRGSGSACRSLYGGCVMWKMGTTGSNKNRTEKEDDGHDEQDNNNNNNEPSSSSSSYYNNDDSIAEPIADEHSWPEMRVLIIVTKDTPKDIGSTIGMQRSVSTSSLLQYRATTEIVPIRIKQIMKAWSHHDFHTFGTICMQDSNQFHAICCDTYPPIYYMTDVSKKIVKLITTYNAFQKNNNNKNQNSNITNINKDNSLSDEKKENGNNNNNNNKTLQEEQQQEEEVRAAYTFDAGPNAVIYVLEKDVIELGALMLHYFPNDTYNNNNNNYLRGGFDVTIMHEKMIQYTLDPNLIIACDHALFGKQQQHTTTTTTTSNNKQQQQQSSSSSTSSLTTSSDGCSREVQFMYLTRVGSGPKVLMEPTLGSKVAAAAKMAATATEAVSGGSGVLDTSRTTTIITNIDPSTGLNSYVPPSKR